MADRFMVKKKENTQAKKEAHRKLAHEHLAES